jgi:tetratricopeptide (TPR) repeat protein
MQYSHETDLSAHDDARDAGARRWIALLLFVSLIACVLGALVIPGALGFIVGQQQLEEQTHEAAIQHFNRGLGYLAENYPELAFAEFQIALKYDYTYEPARQKLLELQAKSNPAGRGTPAAHQEDLVAATLYNEARGLIAQKQWDDAILRLEQLRTLQANFRSAEVKSLLYQAYVEDGKEAVASGHIETARERFDGALAIGNGDPRIQTQRELAVLYLEGKQDAGYNWQTAIQKFTLLYQRDPNYADVKKQLADAHTQYGDIAAKTSPCLAVREYDGALALVQEAVVSQKRAQAMTQCKQVISSPPTPTATAAPGAESFAYKIATDNKSCVGVGDISGVVRDALGKPMANALVGYSNDGTNFTTARTSANGQYQVALNKEPGTFTLAVLSTDGKTPNPMSATVQYPGGNATGCHIVVDWQKVQ